MEPVTTMLAISAASTAATSLMSWLSSKNAAQASASERKRISDLVDAMKQPDFDFSTITPEEFKVVGKYVPEVASYIQEAAPQVMQGISAGRDAEKEALNRWLEMSRSGRDDIFDIQQRQAARTAAGEQQAQIASLQDLSQRQGGGGLPQGAALRAIMSNRSGELAQQGALDAAQRRTQALQQVGTLGSQVRQADMSLEEKNANIINDFNRRLAENGNQYNQYKTGVLNNAQLANLAQAQKTSDANIGARNEATASNMTNRNNLVQKQFDNQMSQINAKQGIANSNIAGINNAANQSSQMYAGINDAILKGSGAYADYAQKDKELDRKYPVTKGNSTYDK
jgi:hypothetical protein